MAKKIIFKIDKKAFSGPFKCHGETKLVKKKISVGENLFSYSIWKCKCGKEYLDTNQAKQMEAIWIFEKMVTDELIGMERSLNHDGKMFFLRFPMELSSHFKKGNKAEIKVVDSKRFLVEIK